jgi:arginine exporter protein ArgO
MVSRFLGILIAPWLLCAALILPIGPAHALNAAVVGPVALVFSAFCWVDDRARFGAAILGAWVALTAFLFRSNLLEQVTVVPWGVAMFVFMAGPFSAPAGLFRTRATTSATTTLRAPTRSELPLAA